MNLPTFFGKNAKPARKRNENVGMKSGAKKNAGIAIMPK
jgi:hypothetical protein